MVLRHDQQVSPGSTREKLRQSASRALLIFALLGGSLGFLAAPEPVAAAGWNHFVDPFCGSGSGKAWPGINWSGYGFWDDATDYSQMYRWTGSYYLVDYQSYSSYHRGSSGDIRNYAVSWNGANWYRGEVVYSTSFAGSGSYAENFYCP